MKRLISCVLILPFFGMVGLPSGHAFSTNIVEVRSGDWPINLEKSDTSYALLFRDQQVTNSVVMDTLPFPNLEHLKYFQQALTVLKTGHHGDIAKFSDYSIKRTDVKYKGTWYLLRIKWGLTNFQQPEADLMIKTIKNL
jgi:hypothetical protein